MDDLLKEAIADAKAVRETALENAKIALEEAFTPRLQSMLSRKIQSEIDVDEQEDEMEDDEEEEEAPEEGMTYEDEDSADDESEDEMEDEMGEAHEEGHEDEDEEEMDMEGVIEINGVKYAPVVTEQDDEDAEEEEEDEDDLDLEAVLRELEDEEEEEAEEPVDEQEDAEEDEEEDVDEEVDKSSGVGKGDNHKGESDQSSVVGSKDKAKHHESVEKTDKVVGESDEEVEEEIDLEEVIKALSEEEDEEDATNEVAKLQSDLDEHRNVVKYLRSKLNEVNLLNAKLLFTNKLFRSYGLSNEQKMKVVENFDRAHNLREVKLVYSTLAESFGSKPKTEIKESKGSASKPVASTKSKKQEVIAEGHEMRERFKKLAGIIS